MSIFAKITWLAVVASLMTGGAALYFVSELFSELREDARARRFNTHAASDMVLQNPSQPNIERIAEITGLVIRYRGPDGERFAGDVARFEDVRRATPARSRSRPRTRFHPDGNRPERNTPAAGNSAVARADREDVSLVRGLDGRPYLLRRRGPSRVLVGDPPAAFSGRVWEEAQGTLGGLAATLGVLWLGFYFFQRRMLAPLARLRRNMEAVGTGEWREADESRRDEFGRLARVFNEMQRRLRVLLQSKQRMLAAASHELRTPLTRLKLATEFVSDDRLRERMTGNVRELEGLTAEILEQSRMEALPAETTETDLDALARLEAEQYRTAGTPLELDLRSGMKVEADPERARRALRTVVDNSLKFARSRVRVSTIRLPDGRGEMRVEDDGPGATAKDLPHLFEAFYRADESRTRETGGYGLGLALAKTAVESQGGELAAWNNPDGPGLVMVIRFRGAKKKRIIKPSSRRSSGGADDSDAPTSV